MVAPPHCRLCEERHWSGDGHKYPKGLESPEWVKAFVSARPTAVPVAAPIARNTVNDFPMRTVASFPAEDLDDEGENYVLRECEVCETEFESKRADARFCSAKCRKKASREAK